MHGSAQAQVVDLGAAGVEAGFDVAQTFAPSQLGEGQTDKLAPARELADLGVAAVAGDTALELLGMDPIEKLREDLFAGIHAGRVAPGGSAVEIAHTSRPARQPCHQRTKSNSPQAMTGHLWQPHSH